MQPTAQNPSSEEDRVTNKTDATLLSHHLFLCAGGAKIVGNMSKAQSTNPHEVAPERPNTKNKIASTLSFCVATKYVIDGSKHEANSERHTDNPFALMIHEGR